MSYKVMASKNGALPTAYGDSYTGDKFYKDNVGNIYYGSVQDDQDEDHPTPVLDGTTTKYLKPETEMTDGTISAVAAYVSETDLVADVDVASTFNDLEITGLAYGYYYVTTSTGSVVAINSTNRTVTVGDKNTVPSVDKTITSVANNKDSVDGDGKKAIAEVGSTVNFKSVITVGKGAANYSFKDKLDDTLTLDTTAGKISVGYLVKNAASDATPTSLIADTDYILSTTAGGTGEGAYTFKIDFNKNSEAAQNALSEGSRIVITYSATVNSQALQANAAKNTAWVSYGNNPGSTYDTVPSTTETYNAKLTVKKTDGDDNPLSGAGFKLKNADGKYYKESTVDGKTTVSWVDTEAEGTQKDVTEVTVDGTKVQQTEFNGLGSGTYTLVETMVPQGYNKAADKTITVKAANGEGDNANNFNTDLTLNETVKNIAGSLLPSTGGIGTTLFYVIGGVIVAGAAILLIAKRKKRA